MSAKIIAEFVVVMMTFSVIFMILTDVFNSYGHCSECKTKRHLTKEQLKNCKECTQRVWR